MDKWYRRAGTLTDVHTDRWHTDRWRTDRWRTDRCAHSSGNAVCCKSDSLGTAFNEVRCLLTCCQEAANEVLDHAEACCYIPEQIGCPPQP